MADREPVATPPAIAPPAGVWRARLLTEHWRIGLIDAPIHALLDPARPVPIRWLTGREHAGYWADPFGLPGDSRRLFCERFDERTASGRIELLELHGDGLRPIRVVDSRDEAGAERPLGRGRHASFPNVFVIDGRRYAIAETGAARECVLHRVDARGAWHSPVTLLTNVAAADPALFRHAGHFWLAFTDADIGLHDNLCLYRADRIEGPWQPHAANPVKVDARGARMGGGFFEHAGNLYRTGQDCRETYGAAVVLFRVDECSPRAYRETPVRRIAPDRRGPLPHGLHTLTAWGERTLVDGKRYVFSAVALRRKLVARFAPRRRAAATGGGGR